MPTALVTGANRGLGLEHVRQFAARGWRVIAACRDPQSAAELREVKGDVRVLAYDAADEAAPARLAAELGAEPIDVLLNNAGVIGGAGGHSGQSFAEANLADMAHTFAVNSVAPLLLTRALIENVAASSRKVVAMQSSQMGSIADASGGYYAYRASKAALNMIAKALAMDLAPRGIVVVTLHPGWVQTRMGGDAAPLSPEESIAGEQRVLDGLTREDSGKFLRYSGHELPW